jgi:hypothetical protein
MLWKLNTTTTTANNNNNNNMSTSKKKGKRIITITRTGWSSGDALDSYSEDARFESQPGHRLS